MAVIGDFRSLKDMFYKTSALNILSEYLAQALKTDGEIYKRILSTDGENKVMLNDGMFAIEQNYYLKDISKSFFETHLQYVDFQLVVFGEEYFLLGDKQDFIQDKIDINKDLITYKPCYKASQIYLKQGTLAVFFENDVHAGGLALCHLTTSQKVYKTVVKVPKELLKLKF